MQRDEAPDPAWGIRGFLDAMRTPVASPRVTAESEPQKTHSWFPPQTPPGVQFTQATPPVPQRLSSVPA